MITAGHGSGHGNGNGNVASTPSLGGPAPFVEDFGYEGIGDLSDQASVPEVSGSGSSVPGSSITLGLPVEGGASDISGAPAALAGAGASMGSIVLSNADSRTHGPGGSHARLLAAFDNALETGDFTALGSITNPVIPTESSPKPPPASASSPTAIASHARPACPDAGVDPQDSQGWRCFDTSAPSGAREELGGDSPSVGNSMPSGSFAGSGSGSLEDLADVEDEEAKRACVLCRMSSSTAVCGSRWAPCWKGKPDSRLQKS